MVENIPDSYEFLKSNIYNKMKRKILFFRMPFEYTMISGFLLNPNILKCFLQKQMNNIFFDCSFSKHKENSKNSNCNNQNNNYNAFFIFNNDKGENKYYFKVKSIYNASYFNHSLFILRFIKEERNNNSNDNNSKNEQFIDSIISFYIDINDNSTILINEYYYNVSDSLFIRFNELVNIFYEKLDKFIKEKMNKFLSFGSILIDKNKIKILDFLYSCKLFHNKNFQVKKIIKEKEKIQISCQIGHIGCLPINQCEAKIFIISLSHNCSLFTFVYCMNTSEFKMHSKLLNINSSNSFLLKKLRYIINNEDIDSFKAKDNCK